MAKPKPLAKPRKSHGVRRGKKTGRSGDVWQWLCSLDDIGRGKIAVPITRKKKK